MLQNKLHLSMKLSATGLPGSFDHEMVTHKVAECYPQTFMAIVCIFSGRTPADIPYHKIELVRDCRPMYAVDHSLTITTFSSDRTDEPR